MATGSSDFYVYLHKRASDGSVFYVGKGKGRRATFVHGRNAHWRNIVAKHGFIVEYVLMGIQEWYAFELESQLITYYGRESLCNLTDGGEGMSGYTKSAETKRRLKEAMNRRKLTPDLIERMVGHRRGSKHTDATRAAMSASWEKPARRAERRAAMAEAKPGRRVRCVETGQVFEKLIFASHWLRESGLPSASQANIVRCCRKKRPTAYGYRWEYV